MVISIQASFMAAVKKLMSRVLGIKGARAYGRICALVVVTPHDDSSMLFDGFDLEILDRLGRLNRERYEDEVEAGLHGKKKAAGRKKSAPAAEKKSSKASASASEESADNPQGKLFENDQEGQ